VSQHVRYEVYRSGGPDYPTLCGPVPREEAEGYATEHSASDADGRTFVVERADTWEIVAEYRRGELRLDRPYRRSR
jgi:hypothetical protein